MIAIDHSRYVLVALRRGAKFRGEARLVLYWYFSFHAADFPSSAILNSFQELRHRTRTHSEQPCSHGTTTIPVDTMYLYMYALLPADLVSAGPAPGAALRMLHCMLTAKPVSYPGQSMPVYDQDMGHTLVIPCSGYLA